MFNLLSIFSKNKKISSKSKDEYKIINQKILKSEANRLNIPADKLKELWLSNYLQDAEDSFKQEFNQKLEEIKKHYQENSTNIFLELFNRLNYPYFRHEFIIKIPCRNQDIRSRLVGLNGRNKKSFERTCGVELIVNEGEDFVSISSANHIKREIASRVIKRLIEIKNIEPNKIENYYNEEKINFEDYLVQVGKDVIEKQLKLKNIDPNLYPYVGKLKYRYSYGQNVLEHSLESAYLAEQLAYELKVDPELAKMSTFFHDIGKSVDHETGKDHVEQGLIIASQFNLPYEVLTSIESHHDAISVTSIYDSITKLVDKLSACKPGARKNTKDDFFRRAKIYEDICLQFPEVQTCYVLKSGFLIKVIVKPNAIKDEDINLLAYKIKKAFETNEETKKYILTIELIKETTFKVKTEKNDNYFD